MHVLTETKLDPREVEARLATLPQPSQTGDALCLATDRSPKKLFLVRAPVTLPASAEVEIRGASAGAEVELRLMWGPLPAPFPRAVAAVGIALGAILVALGEPTTGRLALAASLALLPLAGLMYQRSGERDLQARLAALLDAAAFRPVAH